MMPYDEYQEALSNTTAFKHKNPEEKTTAAARIYQVNNSSVQTTLLREQQQQTKPATSYKGHNKVLSKVQVAAIYKYVEDSYLSKYNATKTVAFATVSYLKANKVVPKLLLIMQWF
jgi:flagellar hook assembly protein FlgD